jgi:hypothetical protein
MDDTSISSPGYVGSGPGPVPMADLKESPLAGRPEVAALSAAELNEIATAQLDQRIAVTDAPFFELTARRPYGPAGRMDFFKPGRWDCELDLVFMFPIVTGPSPGMWDGTAGYVQHTTSTTGSHLVAVRFSGYQTTMEARGPWGPATAYCAATSDTSTVTALWQANAGDVLNFTLRCTGDGIGYLQSVQVRPLV